MDSGRFKYLSCDKHSFVGDPCSNFNKENNNVKHVSSYSVFTWSFLNYLSQASFHIHLPSDPDICIYIYQGSEWDGTKKTQEGTGRLLTSEVQKHQQKHRSILWVLLKNRTKSVLTLGIPKNLANFYSHTQNIFVMFWGQKSTRSPLKKRPMREV